MNPPPMPSMFDEIRKPLTAAALGFTYRYMLDQDVNSAVMYAGIVGLSDMFAAKTSEMLVPDLDNLALNSLKNLSVQGGLAAGINSGLQLLVLKDGLVLENAIVGAASSISAILLEPTVRSII